MWQVTDPKVVELSDDRTDTYLRAIRPEINPQLQASYNIMCEDCIYTLCMYVVMKYVHYLLDCCGCVSNITR